MKALLLLTLLLFTVNSYSQPDIFECPMEKVQQYTYNGSIKPRAWGVDTGQFIVLKHQQRYDCDVSHHNMVIGTLMWAIPKNQTSLQLTVVRNDSSNLLLQYHTTCGAGVWCLFGLQSAEGFISGQLENGIWKIKGTISLYLHNTRTNQDINHQLILDGEYKIWRQSRKQKKYREFYGFD